MLFINTHMVLISHSQEANWRDNCFWTLASRWIINVYHTHCSVKQGLYIWHLLFLFQSFIDAFNQVKIFSISRVISKMMNYLYYLDACILNCFQENITEYIIHVDVCSISCVYSTDCRMNSKPCWMGLYCYYSQTWCDCNQEFCSDLLLFI